MAPPFPQLFDPTNAKVESVKATAENCVRTEIFNESVNVPLLSYFAMQSGEAIAL
jgi:hypothetical protein